MIEVKNLVKKYGDHTAVNNISFTVEEGRVYGFLGPNGAGKSTTMNIMTGYMGATRGEVIVNGFNILEEPQKAKQCIGYLPELPPLYVDMTVYEYLKFVAELKKIEKSKIADSVEEVCKLVEIMDMQGRLIKNLSKGYKQRVGLASAIIGFPDVIILDEPMVGLDPKQIIEIRELIKELSKNHTIILSSHILAEVKEICDHIIIISNGNVVASDTPENLEHMIYGQETIEIEVKEHMERVKSILTEVKGIESYTCTEKDEIITAIINSDGTEEELCEILSIAFVKGEAPLRKIVTTKATLEDVFLELTKKAPVVSNDEEESEEDTGDVELSDNILDEESVSEEIARILEETESEGTEDVSDL
ncbi:MAG: ABC transporter ATP-binding protein [Eubacteriales bacterium]